MRISNDTFRRIFVLVWFFTIAAGSGIPAMAGEPRADAVRPDPVRTDPVRLVLPALAGEPRADAVRPDPVRLDMAEEVSFDQRLGGQILPAMAGEPRADSVRPDPGRPDPAQEVSLDQRLGGQILPAMASEPRADTVRPDPERLDPAEEVSFDQRLGGQILPAMASEPRADTVRPYPERPDRPAMAGEPRADSVRPDPERPDPAQEVSFEQRLGERIPLDLVFRDESGQPVRLSTFFDRAPVVLQFAYYDCPMLCSLVFTKLASSIREAGLELGEQYRVITVSIDPGETPELAAAKKAAFLRDASLPGADLAVASSTGRQPGWSFLTGDQASITSLAEAAGFRYAYDAEIDQYAHPAGLVVLTPQGKISRYLFGIDFPARDLRLSLVEATEQKIGTPTDRLFLLCYRYDPVSGRYTLLIGQVLRLAGLATVLLLGGLVLVLSRRDRGRRPAGDQPEPEALPGEHGLKKRGWKISSSQKGGNG